MVALAWLNFRELPCLLVRSLGACKTSTGVGVPCFLEGQEVQEGSGSEDEGFRGWQERTKCPVGVGGCLLLVDPLWGLGWEGDLQLWGAGLGSPFSLPHWADPGPPPPIL